MKESTLKYAQMLMITTVFLFSLPPAFTADTPANPVNFEKILTDPLVVKEFDELKNAVSQAEIGMKNGKPAFSEEKITQFDAMTDKLLSTLKDHDHLIPSDYKAHTYVGRYQPNSCYQYYNSLVKNSIGKLCTEFPEDFSNCKECNGYVRALKTIPKNNVLHARWWKKEVISSLVKVVTLKNGDVAYVGFELSPQRK